MMRLTEAAQALGAQAPGVQMLGTDVEFTSVSTDTRTIRPGALFVALRGERFDGHDFVDQALAAGAAAAMVDEKFEGQGNLLRVPDTRLGLGHLAAYWRGKFDLPLVAVTGSNGKTTVKEMIASILRTVCGDDAQVLATEGNLNNDIGVPQMLLRLTAQHRYAVIEMGMNHFGEIDYLTRLAVPDVALVNNAQAAHLAGVGSVEGVARAKGEIYNGLKAGGTAVLDFALDHPAAVTGSYQLLAEGVDLEIVVPRGKIRTRLHAAGVHNVRNALAASAVAAALNVPCELIGQGLARFAPVKGRLQHKPALHGATLIDDTYNANPASMRAAIDVLAALPGKRVLVLGDMGELGEDAWALHGEIGAYARERGIDILFCLGDNARNMAAQFGQNAWHFERIQELLADLENLLAPGVTVLVKGSRFMEMERVVKSFEMKERYEQ
jgi:UDP-N-acetylmuramoyl-tripeptide--D-alanyl-D-alanine ligase